MKTINDVPIILRREIEAVMIAPFIKAFAKELGKEKTLEIASKVIADMAYQAGKEMAAAVGNNSLENFMKMMPAFSQGGALEIDVKKEEKKCAQIDITHCAYVDMYKRNGLSDLGSLLSCQRDSYLFKGFNPNIEFKRTNTIMEGFDCCDFCLRLKEEE